ncbi:MAG TPA: NAD-dependent epimerase/dehydratase family protein [Burkholderiaceae bacterium]|nr:NAD-dependent epimerase/dehydratase family protein [Burkholderiaceae bacterium]
MKRIFLTGATGFLGSHVLAALHAENYSIVATTRGDTSTLPKRLVDRRTEWISTVDAASVIEAVKPHAVIHLATDYGGAPRLQDTLLANEAWPLRLLEAGIRSGTEIFLNTDSFFAKPAFAYPHMRPYTLSKSHFLAWGRLAATGTQTRFITLRLEHVFGENDRPNKFVPSMLRQLKIGEIVEATAGTQRRDFIYAGDVASAFTTVLKNHGALGQEMDEIDVGTGQSITVRSFVELAKSLSCSSSPLRFGSVPMRQNEIMDSFADIAILRMLGWAPRSSVEDGLRRCIADLQPGEQ